MVEEQPKRDDSSSSEYEGYLNDDVGSDSEYFGSAEFLAAELRARERMAAAYTQANLLNMSVASQSQHQ